MPKFYRQNKKRIDPRYFLEETTNRDNLLEANEKGKIAPYTWEEIEAPLEDTKGAPQQILGTFLPRAKTQTR